MKFSWVISIIFSYIKMQLLASILDNFIDTPKIVNINKLFLVTHQFLATDSSLIT